MALVTSFNTRQFYMFFFTYSFISHDHYAYVIILKQSEKIYTLIFQGINSLFPFPLNKTSKFLVKI